MASTAAAALLLPAKTSYYRPNRLRNLNPIFIIRCRRRRRPILTRAGTSEPDPKSIASPPDIGRLNSSSGSPDGYIGLFVRMLGLDNDPLDREQAVTTLWKFSEGGKDCIDGIMQFPGCINLVVNLLKSDSLSTCEAAAGLLRTVSSVSSYRDKIAQCGAIEELTRLLCQSSLTSEVKEESLYTLWNLSVTEILGEKMANSELLPMLVKFLDDKEIKIKEAAGGILANLALNKYNHSIMVEAGVIPKLADLVTNATDGFKVIRKEAKTALLELSKDKDYLTLIIEEGLIRVPIIGASAYKSFKPPVYSWPSLPDGTKVQRTPRPSRYGASDLLLGLNIPSKNFDLEEVKMNVIVGRSQQQFLARIGAIEAEDDKKSPFESSPTQQYTFLSWLDGVARLVLILGLENASAVARASYSIADASINEYIRISFKEAGAVRDLVQLLSHNDMDIRQAATHALERLSFSTEVFDTEVISCLIRTLGTSPPDIQMKVASILEYIVPSEPHAITALLCGIESGLSAVFQPKCIGANNEDELELNIVEIEETGLAIAAASRLLVKLLHVEAFRRDISCTHFVTVLRKILKLDFPLSTKDWVAACLVKLESLVSSKIDLENPIEAEVTVYETIPRLVELMCSFSYESQEAAVVKLKQIIARGAEFSRAVAAAGGIFPLVKLMDEGNGDAVEASLVILYNLSMDSENHAAIIAAGAVPILKRIVLSERSQWMLALRLLRTLPT